MRSSFANATGAEFPGAALALDREAGIDLRDAIVVAEVLVEGQLVSYPQPDEQGNGHADGQAGDIDQRMGFGAGQTAKGGPEIVEEHSSCCWEGWRE